MAVVTGHQLTADSDITTSNQVAREAGPAKPGPPAFRGFPLVVDFPNPTVSPPDRRYGPVDSRRVPARQQSALGIPARVLSAYRNAAELLAQAQPGCGLDVPLLAAIGKVESGHARGGQVDQAGRTLTPILGPRLDGGLAVRAIRDTDDGVYDGDEVWDRAVGPMQFIPSTWRSSGADANSDGVADPHNVDDAALAAGHYLCAAGGDLSRPEGLRRAILAYNHSGYYLTLVLAWMQAYSGGTIAAPASPPAPGVRASNSPNRTERPAENEQADEHEAKNERGDDELTLESAEPAEPSRPEEPRPPQASSPPPAPVTTPPATSSPSALLADPVR